ncbi:glycosyltransferase [Microlunatus soli]|uniref:Glycosyl transferases group 1 n=1 Tax=Microlunatus soli TaxID=630515 RepID=A0A1H2AN47_9ACTN|nr:glycosyltransferase [Microlunatus soli]SDT47398.1 Glycosyl transferases group 1 [Microlunatus soli]
MGSAPLVSIVIPVFNDQDWLADALTSAQRQTMRQLEIICIDDASTDASLQIIEAFQQRDDRIRIIRQERNLSAFQARRVGILAATGRYVLFLDGDDELDRHAAAKAVAKAESSGADLVGFGVKVIGPNGGVVGGYQSRLMPAHGLLEGEAILAGLFPVGKPAQGQIWRYLFRTELLRNAYARVPDDLVLNRINDLPITFLAVAEAQRYVSIQDRLYSYHFRRGASGHLVEELSQFAFYAGGIDSVDSIGSAVHELARRTPDPEPLIDGYQTARLSIVGNVLSYLIKSVSSDLYEACLDLLLQKVSEREVVQAAAQYAPGALDFLARHGKRIELGQRPVHSVLLTTRSLTTGGVSGVLLAQARHLLDAGYQVTIVAHRDGSVLDGLPEGATFVQLGEGKLSARLAEWAEICRRSAVDVVIDHRVLYSREWPAFAQMARAMGAPTIGWVHNFAMRPVYDLKDLLSFITDHANTLATLVALSPLDVEFWKLRGVSHAAYLPNPPSPLLVESAATADAKPAPCGRRLELIWWGRLEQHTKQPRQLLAMATELRTLNVDFRLRIIGPDWADLTAAQLADEVGKRGLGEQVAVVGPLHGQALADAIDSADLFVGTSIIEGYPLALAEAQARGLPIVMYDLPWLAAARDNEGLVATPQGDAAELARQIAEIADDPDRYDKMSRASVDAAHRALALDFSTLYRQLVAGMLPAEYSPEPTLAGAQQLLDLMVFFVERNTGAVSDAQETPSAQSSGAAGQRETADRKGRTTGPAFDSPLVRSMLPFVRRVYRLAPGLKPAGRRLKLMLPAAVTRDKEARSDGT